MPKKDRFTSPGALSCKCGYETTRIDLAIEHVGDFHWTEQQNLADQVSRMISPNLIPEVKGEALCQSS